MSNLKWGVVSAGIAFVLAFSLSLLIGRTGLLIASLRAGIFTILFFGLGIGIRALINTFIPELLSSEARGDTTSDVFFGGAAGSKVNITVDDTLNSDTSSAAMPAAMPGDNDAADADEVGNFGDLLSAGITKALNKTSDKTIEDIDQTPAASYTEEAEEFTPVFEEKITDTGGFSLDFGAFVPGGIGDDGMDDLDLGMDSFSFLPSSGNSGNSERSSAPERKVSGNKSMKLEGDFQAKEIAAGLRTVLEKDKKKG